MTDASLIIQLPKVGKAFASLNKPEKIYLQNTNQLYALSGLQQANPGTVREVFFANMMLATGHMIQVAQQGDFVIDNQWTFEIGGRNKDQHQIKVLSNAYLALDNLEAGFGKQIPLWLFGLLY